MTIVTHRLNDSGLYPTVLSDSQFNKNIVIAPTRELRVTETVRLAGANFNGSTLDTNFWTATVANNGAVTQGSGEVRVRTGTTANGSAVLSSARVGRFMSSNFNAFRGVVQLGDTGATNNTRRWGIMDSTSATDGAFFQLAGTTFSIVTRKGSSDTAVNSGSFSGTGSYTLDTNAHTYEIAYGSSRLWFFIDDVLIHTVSASSATWAATLNHRLYVSNTNASNSTTDLSIYARALSLVRYGEAFSRPQYYNNANVNETRVLKYGPGTIHGITFNDPAAAGTITLYDNTAGSGTKIATIDTSAINTVTTLEFGPQGLDFFTGFTYVSASGPGDFTVVYE